MYLKQPENHKLTKHPKNTQALDVFLKMRLPRTYGLAGFVVCCVLPCRRVLEVHGFDGNEHFET